MPSKFYTVKPEHISILTEVGFSPVSTEEVKSFCMYYIGTMIKGSACRLSKLYRTFKEAKEAFAAGEYTRTVEAITYPNGLTLYYPAEYKNEVF